MRPKLKTPPPLDGLYMDAKEAAALLNVSLPTLYTYVARKNLRAHRSVGSRESWYLRSDVERLKDGRSRPGDRQAAPGLAASTAITFLSEGDAYYRGHKATDLARTQTLEEVARLLWEAGDFDPFSGPWPALDDRWKALRRASMHLEGADRILTMLPTMQSANPRAHDLAKLSFLRSGADIVLQTVAIEMGHDKRASVPVHAHIGTATRCSSALREAIRTVLVLSVDLALEPATYVVRAAANTGTTPYHCVAAGLSAATGKRLPSTRAASFARFIGEIETAKTPGEPVVSRVRENETLPGFGFSPFAAADARSIYLWRTLQHLLQRDRSFDRFDEALRLGQELTGLHPDFALLSTYVSHRAGGSAKPNLVRIGRLVGWIAHAFEQQADAPLIRWRTNYKGPLSH